MKAFFIFIICLGSFASQLRGQVVVTGGTLASGNYLHLKDAIDSINNHPVTSTIVVNVSAGFTDTLTSRIVLTNTGTPSDHIIIQKSGAGANPILVSYTGSVSTPSSLADGFFVLAGSDYVTIDGIDLLEKSTNTTASSCMEFGFGLFKKSAADGCQNNTIKNCTVTMSRVQTGAWSGFGFNGSAGIAMLNALPTSSSSVVVTTSGGSHSFNTIENCLIQQCHTGIAMSGFNAPSPFVYQLNGLGDTNNYLGGETTALGNTIINYGGGGTPASTAIYAGNQWNLTCKQNYVDNNNGNGVNHAGTLRGLYFNVAPNANLNCISNNIKLTGASTANNIIGIENSFGSNGTANQININSNVIQIKAIASVNGSCLGIHSNNSSCAHLKIKNNTFKMSTTATSGVGLFPFSSIAVTGNVNTSIQIDSNQIDTLWLSNNTSMAVKVIYCTGGNNNLTTSISHNAFHRILHTGSSGGSGEVSFITHLGNPISSVLKNNTAQGLAIKTSGTIQFIQQSYPLSPNRTKLVSHNIFQAITRTASATTGSLFGYNDVAIADSLSSITLTQNTIQQLNNGNSTNSVSGINISSTDSDPFVVINRNSIKNITGLGSSNGIFLNGIGGTQIMPCRIDSNEVDLITGNSSPVTAIFMGSKIKYCQFKQNTFDSITGNGNFETAAILATGGINAKNLKFSHNKIYEIKSTHNNGNATGISLGSFDSINITNNLIGLIHAPLSSGLNAVNGIKIGASQYAELNYNTIYLNATSSATNFGASGFFVSSNIPQIVCQNNIVVNQSQAGSSSGYVAALRFQNSLASMVYSGNNNLWFGGTSSAKQLLYGESTNATATNPKASLADFKYYMGNEREFNSITELPSFISLLGHQSSFLHINTTTATEIQNGGRPIPGITTDFDFLSRSVTSPDIGADEGNFIYIDRSPPVFNFTPLGIACDSFDRTLIVTINDRSIVPTTGTGRPLLKWKMRSNGAWQTDTAVYISNNQFSFTFGAGELLPNDTVFYYILAQDAAPIANVIAYPPTNASGYSVYPPAVTTPPSELLFYTRSEQVLNGVYPVGTGHFFPTLTAMVSAYQYYCITGPVEFQLTDPIYTVDNILTLQENPFVNATKPVTIKTAPNNMAVIEGNIPNNGLFNFSGSDYITLDGSNTNAGNTQNLIIRNTATQNPAAIKVSGLVDETTHLQFKNLKLETPSSTSLSFGIHLGGSTLQSEGKFIEEVSINNVNFNNLSTGIFAYGNASSPITSLIVDSCQMISQHASNVFGMDFKNVDTLSITQNQISLISSSSFPPTAIALKANTTNVEISKNNIYKVLSTAPQPVGGRGITIATGNVQSNIVITNNFISGMNGKNNKKPASTALGIAIGLADTLIIGNNGGIEVWNNSINLFGNYAGIDTTYTSAIFIGPQNDNLDIRNNILCNTLVNASPSSNVSKSYSFVNESPVSAFDFIDFNDYCVSDTNGVLARILSVDKTTMNELRSVLGQNTHSLNFKPKFISHTDLHLDSLFNHLLDSAAVHLLTTDIDGQQRNSVFSDIGADEFYTSPCNMVTGGFILNDLDSLCSGFSYSMTAQTLTGGHGVKYQWQVSSNGTNFTNVNQGIGIDSTVYTTPNLSADTLYYRQKVWCTFNTDTAYSNSLTLIVKDGNPVSIVPEADTICYLSSTSLSVNGSLTYVWSPSTALSTTTGNSVTANPTSSIRYVVEGTDAMGCKNYDSISVYVYRNPVISGIQSSPDTICANGNTSLSVAANWDYFYEDIVFNRLDTASFAPGPSGDDVTSAPIVLPFNVNWYDQSHNSIYINTNGIVGFEPGISNLTATPNLFPSASIPHNILALCWQNLLAMPSEISYGTVGIAPNRIFVIDYDSVKFKSQPGFVKGQIQLYESGIIEIHIDAITNNPLVKSIGLQNANGSLGTGPLGYNFTSFTLNSPKAWKFYRPSINYNWNPISFLNDPSITNPMASGVDATTMYTATAQALGCSAGQNTTVTVILGPSIDIQPQSLTVCPNDTALIYVTALGSDDLSYLWYKNGDPLHDTLNIMGSTSSILKISNATVADAGIYRVEIFDCNTSLFSEEATLALHPLPPAQITGPDTLCGSSSLVLYASSNPDMNYQWKKNNMIIVSAQLDSLMVDNSGKYSCIVTDPSTNCSALSENTLVLINEPMPLVGVDPSPINVCGFDTTLLHALTLYDNTGDTLGLMSNTSTNMSPFASSSFGKKIQLLYTVGELKSIGLAAGSILDSIGFITDGSLTDSLMNFTVKAIFISDSILTPTFVSDQGQEVFNAPSFLPVAVNGRIMLSLSSSLVWDGISSLILDICFQNQDTVGNTLAVEVETKSNVALYKVAGSIADACALTGMANASLVRPLLVVFHHYPYAHTWQPLTQLFLDGNLTQPYLGQEKDSVYFNALTSVSYQLASENVLGCISTFDVDAFVTNGLMVLSETNDGPFSLRKTYECATEGDTIIFDSSVNSIDLTDSLKIDKTMVVSGNGIDAPVLFWDFSQNNSLPLNVGLKVLPGKMLHLQNVTIHQTANTMSRPVIINEGHLKIETTKINGTLPPIILNRGILEVLEEVMIISD